MWHLVRSHGLGIGGIWPETRPEASWEEGDQVTYVISLLITLGKE